MQYETFEKLKDFLITIFFDYKKLFPLSRHREFLPFRHCESLFSRHCESFPFRHCEERSDEAISLIAPPLHCEPKGWQVCWREAISSLHIPVGVKCSGGIASPDCYQARNDECCVCNDAPFRHCEGAARSNLLVASCISFYKNSLLTRCKVFIPEGLG